MKTSALLVLWGLLAASPTFADILTQGPAIDAADLAKQLNIVSAAAVSLAFCTAICFCQNSIMSMALEELTKEAIHLPRHQRLALASFLLELEDSSGDSAVDTDWDAEIGARIQAIDEGAAVGIPYADVLRAADDRLTP